MTKPPGVLLGHRSTIALNVVAAIGCAWLGWVFSSRNDARTEGWWAGWFLLFAAAMLFYWTGRHVGSRPHRNANDNYLRDAVTRPDATHFYLSTSCLHGDHEHCRSAVNVDGDPKRPGTCKHCGAVCRCQECRHGG